MIRLSAGRNIMKTIKTVRISTKSVGQSFGTIGVLTYRSGRRAAETETLPYGFTAAATIAAEALAAKLGFAVVDG
jgi:hypothetical protein